MYNVCGFSFFRNCDKINQIYTAEVLYREQRAKRTIFYCACGLSGGVLLFRYELIPTADGIILRCVVYAITLVASRWAF